VVADPLRELGEHESVITQHQHRGFAQCLLLPLPGLSAGEGAALRRARRRSRPRRGAA
jgi:hypothetical protein